MFSQARIPVSEHSRHRWRVADIAPDFELIDAWSLPASGQLHEFADLHDLIGTMNPADDADARVSNLLFAIRFKLGAWFGWDNDKLLLSIPGCEETSLTERLPNDLQRGQELPTLSNGFMLVFRTATEWAAEISNSTVHAILHLGWVLGADGRYRGQLGVYVKNRGRFGKTYMSAIAPFRHWIVYPALMRRIDHAWQSRPSGGSRSEGL